MREKGNNAFDDVVDENSDPDTEPAPAHGTSSDSDGVEKSSPNSPPEETDSEARSSSSSSQSQGEESEPAVSDSTPAFSYSEVTQRPIYAREETWNQVEDLKYYSEGVLREQHGVRNAETREFDEALAELITEKLTPEELAAKLTEVRGFDK